MAHQQINLTRFVSGFCFANIRVIACATPATQACSMNTFYFQHFDIILAWWIPAKNYVIIQMLYLSDLVGKQVFLMNEDNRRIVRIYKIVIISFVALLMIFPWGLSITALVRISRLQTQLESLTARLEQRDNVAVGPLLPADAVVAIPPAPGLRDATKIAYLTFDDGPSRNTQAILDILRQYGVRATFFVVGRSDGKLAGLYRTILEEGHSLGIHSYSHDYGKVYASSDACINDIDQLAELLFNSTGVHSSIYRFPGGSSNRIASTGLIADVAFRLAQREIQYFDWNVDSGDGRSRQPSAGEIVSNVVNGSKQWRRANILLHDDAAKRNTVEALPAIIESLQAQGFVFDRLTNQTEPTQHRVFATVSLLSAISSRREQLQP